MRAKIVLLLSLPLAVLLIIVSCVGLFTPGFYALETLNWQVQSVGQDMVDLFLISPCLLITSLLTYKNIKTATMIWGGVVLYLTYTFVLYCFDVHFNKLFLLYCLCLGLAFYSFVYFLSSHCKKEKKVQLEMNSAIRFVGVYFILIAVLFYMLWLCEIIPSIINKTIPKSVTDTGLSTNGVQVLDLAILLPLTFIIGLLLLRRRSFAFMMAPVLLTFFILMDLTIGILVIIMNCKGIESDPIIAIIMGVLALVSLVLLIWFLKKNKSVFVK